MEPLTALNDIQKQSKPAQQRKKQVQARPGLESKMKPVPKSKQPDSQQGKLVGKIALITGGDSGIGKAVAIGSSIPLEVKLLMGNVKKSKCLQHYLPS